MIPLSFTVAWMSYFYQEVQKKYYEVWILEDLAWLQCLSIFFPHWVYVRNFHWNVESLKFVVKTSRKKYVYVSSCTRIWLICILGIWYLAWVLHHLYFRTPSRLSILRTITTNGRIMWPWNQRMLQNKIHLLCHSTFFHNYVMEDFWRWLLTYRKPS